MAALTATSSSSPSIARIRSPNDSVASMRKTIETLGPQQSGGFFNYDGQPYPW